MPRPCRILFLAIIVASPLAAQVEFTPYVGVYLPAGHVVDDQNSSQFSSVEHQVALAGGFKGTAWIRPRIALEGDVLYSPSGTTGSAGDQSAKVGIASIRLLYATSGWQRSGLYLFVGPAAVFHRGEPFDSITAIRAANGETTHSEYWGAVFGVGVRSNRKSPVGWDIEFEDNYYEFPGIVTPQWQHDRVVSAGLRFALGGPS